MFDLPEQQHQQEQFTALGIVGEGWIVICYGIVLICVAMGCSSSETVSPEIAEQAAGLTAFARVESKQDVILTAIEASTVAIGEVKEKVESLEGSLLETRQAVGTLEASLVVPKVEPGKEVITSAPEPPAKANDTQISPKVATPGASRFASDGTRLRWNIEGNWNPTILETSAHLAREHGIETNGMTHQEMADLHADLHDGKQVAMKSKTVVRVNRGTSCPNGRCPTSNNQRRGLFGGLFR